jgi:hypothetical protein
LVKIDQPELPENYVNNLIGRPKIFSLLQIYSANEPNQASRKTKENQNASNTTHETTTQSEASGEKNPK